jgi:polar amino acid transport system substrate-binding protein
MLWMMRGRSKDGGNEMASRNGASWFIVVFALSLWLLPGLGWARSLDDILKSGQILVGIDLNSPPYGFQDASGNPTGSEVETAELMAKDLGVKLQIVPTTVANRVPYLVTDRVDVIMATFAITAERAKSVWFSNPYGVTGTVVLSPKSVPIGGYADLSGKKIATTRGSAAELALNSNVPQGTSVLRLDDDSAASAALVTGQADALTTTPAIAGELTRRFPDKQFEVKFTIFKYWYGAGVARGATDLLRWINTFVFLNVQNGTMSKISEKWTGLPLPSIPPL